MLKFVDLKQQDKVYKNKIIASIKKIIESTDFINGKINKKVEEKISKKYQLGNSSLVSSGTDALYLALKALKQNFKKGEIITTPFTFFSPSETIINAGFKPVYADIELNDYNISVNTIKSKINKNTVGILPVHIFGYPCDMPGIMQLAKQNNLFVIEDCAQALGAKIDNKFVGSFGDINAFSFYPTKNLGAFGDAGLVSTKKNKLYNFIKLLKNHGSKTPYIHPIVGENSRCDSFQAAVINEKLNTINNLNHKRNILAKKYFSELKDVKQVRLPVYKKNYSSIYHQFTILVKNRASLIRFLKMKKIPYMIYYKKPLYEQGFFNETKPKLKNVEYICKNCLSLPIHPGLSVNDVVNVSKIIKSFYKTIG